MKKVAIILTILLISQVVSQIVAFGQSDQKSGLPFVSSNPPNPPPNPPNPPSTPTPPSSSNPPNPPPNPPSTPTPPSSSNPPKPTSDSPPPSSPIVSSNQKQDKQTSSPPAQNSQQDQQSNAQLVRLRDVQLEGQSLKETLKRLSIRLSSDQQLIPPNPTRRRLLVEQAVQDRIDSFPRPPKIQEQDQVTSSQGGLFLQKNCSYDLWNYSSPTHEFLHIDNSYSNIFPGSVVKSSYLQGVLEGTESQVPVPAGSDLKNPTIIISDQANVNSIKQIYSFGNISRAISKAIGLAAPQNKDLSIYYEMGTTDDLSTFSDRVSFNKGLLKKLGIQTPTKAPFNKYQKKIILLFTKPIATFDVQIKSFTPNQPDTPLNTFYSSNLTLKVFNSQKTWWGPTNPPVFIDSVTYGGIIILTVDYTKVTEKLYKQLEEEAQNGPGAAQKIIGSIVSNPTLKVFSRGPFSSIQIQALKNGKWLDAFIRVPNDITSMVLQPLIYSVKGFDNANFNIANQYNYVKVCASDYVPPTYKILIKLEYILNEAPVVLIIKTLSGNVVLKLYFYCPTIFDLTPYLNDPQMIVVIRPTVSCSCATRRQQVKAGFIVNNVYTHKLQVSCLGNCFEYDAGTYSVYKNTGIISP